jgi:DNA polymerase III subunit alpha
LPPSEATAAEWPSLEMLAHEKELLGFYVTGHPLEPLAPLLSKYSLCNTRGLAAVPARALTRIGGMVAAVQNGFSKKSGKPYCLFTLEDLEGTVQVLCFNENYDKYRELLIQGQNLLVIGEVNATEDKPKIFPQEIMLLEDAPRKYTRQVHLRFQAGRLTPEELQQVFQLVSAHPGRCPLFLGFKQPGGETVYLDTHERYSVMPSRALQEEADRLFGEQTYYAKVDTTLPDRVLKRWERGANGGED